MYTRDAFSVACFRFQASHKYSSDPKNISMLKVVVDTGLSTLFYAYYIRIISTYWITCTYFGIVFKYSYELNYLVHLEGKILK